MQGNKCNLNTGCYRRFCYREIPTRFCIHNRIDIGIKILMKYYHDIDISCTIDALYHSETDLTICQIRNCYKNSIFIVGIYRCFFGRIRYFCASSLPVSFKFNTHCTNLQKNAYHYTILFDQQHSQQMSELVIY